MVAEQPTRRRWLAARSHPVASLCTSTIAPHQTHVCLNQRRSKRIIRTYDDNGEPAVQIETMPLNRRTPRPLVGWMRHAVRSNLRFTTFSQQVPSPLPVGATRPSVRLAEGSVADSQQAAQRRAAVRDRSTHTVWGSVPSGALRPLFYRTEVAPRKANGLSQEASKSDFSQRGAGSSAQRGSL